MADGLRVVGLKQSMDALKRELKNFTYQAATEVQQAARIVVEELMKGTPVWSGETVRNYGVRVDGGRSTGGAKAPIDNGPPGDTNQGGKGPLGPEARRGVNEQAAMQEIIAALSVSSRSPQLRNVTVVNTIDSAKWALVDGGSVPAPGLVRYPGGVKALATQRALGRLYNFR